MMRETRLLLACSLLVLAGSVWAQEGPIKYRQGVMKGMGGHAGAIAQIAYGGVAHKDHLAAHIDAMSALSKMIVTAFEEKALVAEDTPTRAKPDIWEDWDRFTQKANDLDVAFSAFSESAKGGDADAFTDKLDAVWDSCKGCHKKFQTEKD